MELVRDEPLASQDEIAARLERLGYQATQSTISRDLEELGLVRIRDADGRLRYATPASAAARRAGRGCGRCCGVPRLGRHSGNLVVVQHAAGAANAVARALDPRVDGRHRDDRRRRHGPGRGGREDERARTLAKRSCGAMAGHAVSGRVVLAYSGGLDTSVAARWLARRTRPRGGRRRRRRRPAARPREVEARAAAAGAELLIVDARESSPRSTAGRRSRPTRCTRAIPAGVGARPAADRGEGRRGRARGRGATPSPTAAPARATTRSGSRRRSPRWRPTSVHGAGPRGGRCRATRRCAGPRGGASRSPPRRKVYSIDENLWGRTTSAGRSRTPGPRRPRTRSRSRPHPAARPTSRQEVAVGFEQRRAGDADGAALTGAGSIAALDARSAARHGFGRIDMIENRLVGIKSREVYEVPGALALIARPPRPRGPHARARPARTRRPARAALGRLAYDGLWFAPLHAVAPGVRRRRRRRASPARCGCAFYKGSCRVVGRRAARSTTSRSRPTTSAPPSATGTPRASSSSVAAAAGVGRTRAGRGRALRRPAERAAPAVERCGRRVRATPPSPSRPASAPDVAVAATGAPGASSAATVWVGTVRGAAVREAFAFTRSLGFDRRLAPYDLGVTAAHVGRAARAPVCSTTTTRCGSAEIARAEREADAGRSPSPRPTRTSTRPSRRADRAAGRRRARGSTPGAAATTWWRPTCGVDQGRRGGSRRRRRAGRGARRRAPRSTPAPLIPGYTHLQRAQPVLARPSPARARVRARARRRAPARRAARGPTCRRSAPARWPARPSRSTRGDGRAARLRARRSTTRSTPCPTATSRSSSCRRPARPRMHLSRLAEDIVLWSTQEFGFARWPTRTRPARA